MATIQKNVGEKPVNETSQTESNGQQKKVALWWAIISRVFPDTISVYTLALTVFTGGLWLSTHRLAGAGVEQIKLAREEFVASHRPRIRVKFIQGPFLEDGHKFVWVIIANVGETKATIRFLGVDLAYQYENTWLPPGLEAGAKKVDPISLISGERRTFKVVSRIIDSNTFPTIHSLSCVGQIVYTDDTGIQRETGFFRTWSRGIEQFVPSDNQEYEYED